MLRATPGVFILFEVGELPIYALRYEETYRHIFILLKQHREHSLLTALMTQSTSRLDKIILSTEALRPVYDYWRPAPVLTPSTAATRHVQMP